MEAALRRNHLYVGEGWSESRFEKNTQIEPFVRATGDFTSKEACRKWVNNYVYIKEQCHFAIRPDGTVETFADTWGLAALCLFFERYSILHRDPDCSALVKAGFETELHKLIGVPRSWLEKRLEGAADIFIQGHPAKFEMLEESSEERKAIEKGRPLPSPKSGTAASRRKVEIGQLIRRTDNKRFLQSLYGGVCQISGVILRLQLAHLLSTVPTYGLWAFRMTAPTM